MSRFRIAWEAETEDGDVRVNCRMYSGSLCLTDAWATMPLEAAKDNLEGMCQGLLDYILDEAEPANTLPV